MKQTLTNSEFNIWVALLRFLEDNKRMPTREELAKALSNQNQKYSPQWVQYWLRGLERKGWIEIEPLKRRGIKII